MLTASDAHKRYAEHPELSVPLNTTPRKDSNHLVAIKKQVCLINISEGAPPPPNQHSDKGFVTLIINLEKLPFLFLSLK